MLSVRQPYLLIVAVSAVLYPLVGFGAIPENPEARLRSDFKENIRQRYVKWLVDGYLEKHPDQPDVQRQRCVAFIRKMIDLQLSDIEHRSLLKYRDQAEKLRKAAEGDAALKFVEAYTWEYFTESAGERYRDAAEALATQNYPRRLQALARSRSASNFSWAEEHDKAAAEQWREFRKLARQILEANPKPGNLRLAFLDVTPLGPKDELDHDLTDFGQYIDSLTSIDGLNPWLKNMIAGKGALNRAWHIRGTGFADEVDPKVWPEFHKLVGKAKDHLVQAHKLRPDLPEAAIELIQVSMGHLNARRKQNHPRYWFEQAVKAEFDAMPAYGQMSFALLPRWGGTHQKGVMFAAECMRTLRFETEVPYHGVDTIKEIVWRDYDGEFSRIKRFNVFPMIRTVLEGYTAKAEDQETKRRYLSEMLVFADLMNKPQVGRKAWQRLNKIENGFDPNVVRHFRTLDIEKFPSSRVDKILAQSGPAATLIRNATRAQQQKKWDRSIKLYERAAEVAARDKPTLRHIRAQKMLIASRQKQGSGEWVDVKFQPGLAGWAVRYGEWKRIDAQTVEGRSSKKGLLLELNRGVKQPFELRMKVRFVKQRYPQNNSAGVIWHDPNRTPRWKPSWFHGVLLYKDSDNLSRFSPKNKDQTLSKVDVDKSNKFRLKVSDSKATCYVNGEKVWQGAWFEGDDVYLKNPRLGLGGHYWYKGSTIRFSNVKMRTSAK